MNNLEDAINYFNNMIESHSGQIHEYVQGKRLALKLQNIIEKSNFTQDVFNTYLAELEGIGNCGSMYFWLWQYSVYLGYEAGLRVPKDNIWSDKTKNKLKCKNADQFIDNLIKGNWYAILDDKSKPGFIRIIAENNKHRWFPIQCFADKPSNEREYKQKH